MSRTLGVIAVVLALLVPARPASAATTFTVTSVRVTVSANGWVRASTTVEASTKVTASQLGMCVRDANGGKPDFGRQQNVVITTTGVSVAASKTYKPGTYTYFACFKVGATWYSPGPRQTFTVTAGSKILFLDDFNGAAGPYDHTKWGEWSGCTFNSAAYYGNIKCADRSTLDGQGHLSVPATPDTGTSISSKDHFGFTYGTVTARIMVPKQPGYWPAFWTLNGPPNGSSPQLGGELDAMEAYTFASDGYRVAAHNYVDGADTGPRGNPLCGGRDVRGSWHDYGMRVEPGKVTFLFDGAACWSFTPADLPGEPYAFGPNAKNWLLLTLAVGGAGGQQDGLAVDPATLLVDRVEVRAL